MRELPNGRLYHSHLGLFGFQEEGVALTVLTAGPQSGRLAVWDTGIGKALREDQRVLTPAGWRSIGTLLPQDTVYGPDGLPCRVTGVYPQGIRDMWRVVFTDGAEVVCDDEHLWNVRTRSMKSKGLPYRTMTLSQIRGMGLRDSGGGFKHFIPLCSPVDFPPSTLPLDPYLVGAILGDGGITQRTPRITSADPDLIQALTLPVGVSVSHRASKSRARDYSFVTPRGTANPVTQGLRELGLMGLGCHEKFIPDSILWGSAEQRLACLQGLLDTDGYYGGSIEYCSVSRKLADGVVHLVQSLGGTARISEKKTSHRLAYRVRISLPEGVVPFRLARKAVLWSRTVPPTRAIASIHPMPRAEAVCIKVDRADGLFVTEDFVVTHNTHLGMGTAALLFELEEIDLVLVVCEGNKVDEWVDDFEKFTALDVLKYHGSSRKKRLEKSSPQVLVSVYETMRNEGTTFYRPEGKHGTRMKDGPLLDYLRERRVLIIYDEITKLRNRTSDLYKGHYRMIEKLRKAQGCRVLGLTATPMDTSPENLYNLVRIVDPSVAGLVSDFEKNYTLGRDEYNKYIWKKFELPRFAAQMRPAILRKRKSDPDVIDQFPRQVEESLKVSLLPEHQDFYDAISDLEVDESMAGALWTVKRQVAAYPEALLTSDGEIAKMIVEEVGAEGLKAIPSSKAIRLLEFLDPLVKGQGEKVVVFTFFGPSVAPLLARDMRERGFKVYQHHPPMSREKMSQSKKLFREQDGPAILLSSDAGARGMNIPEASYVVHYELPITFSTYRQRCDRNHRIDSTLPSVTSTALLAIDTVEEDIASVCMDRNETQDVLIEDIFAAEQHVLAAERRKRLRL